MAGWWLAGNFGTAPRRFLATFAFDTSSAIASGRLRVDGVVDAAAACASGSGSLKASFDNNGRVDRPRLTTVRFIFFVSGSSTSGHIILGIGRFGKRSFIVPTVFATALAIFPGCARV
jgi:hypothetical protein